MKNRTLATVGTFAAVVTLLVFSSAPALAGPGAVFTSLATGAGVNNNIYETKASVYLNGGPPPNAPCSSAGLPDGDYYFQVTEPSGAPILSSDSINERKFHVTGGLITTYLGTTHGVGAGKCLGAISIQLAPFADTSNPGCEYKVQVSTDSSFPASSTKSDNFKTCEKDPGGPPQEVSTISGVKFYDANLNGVRDNNEVGVPGWQINASPVPLTSSPSCTNLSGAYSFLVTPNSGNYSISEVAPSPGFIPTPGAIWLNTTPISGQASSNPGPNAGPDFGNVCVGAGGGLTLGFWSNKNGQKIETANPTWLTSDLTNLNLKDGTCTNFDPSSPGQLSTWLLNGNAVNMSYMLSVQLAAMKLNVLNQNVSGSALVYAGTPPAGCSLTVEPSALGFISVNDLMTDANNLLLSCSTSEAAAPRACKEFVKTTLDKANNSKNFLQATPCPTPACVEGVGYVIP